MSIYLKLKQVLFLVRFIDDSSIRLEGDWGRWPTIIEVLLKLKFHLGVIDLNIYGVPQERRRTVNPQRRKTEFLANKTVQVNPNGGKQGGIPKKESPGIVKNKSDLNGDKRN